jgi:DNA adenine methylase
VATLSRRIRQAAALRDRVAFVSNSDWKVTLEKAARLGFARSKVFYYFDPPFYAKADRLYRFCFTENDHRDLHDRVTRMKSNWLLSYDPASFILDLYSRNGNEPQHVHLLYSASSGPNLVAAREVVITNLLVLPNATRLWRTNDEWQIPRNRMNGEAKRLNRLNYGADR